MNYGASVAYGALAIALLYAFAHGENNVFVMKCALYAAVAAFVSRYAAYISLDTEQGPHTAPAAVVSVFTTMAAVVLYCVGLYYLKR